MATRPKRRPRDHDRRGLARWRPCSSLRDWYESGKSTRTDHLFLILYLTTPVSPFHGEPVQSVLRLVAPQLSTTGLFVDFDWSNSTRTITISREPVAGGLASPSVSPTGTITPE